MSNYNELLRLAQAYDGVVENVKRDLTEWEGRRAEVYAELRRVCPHPEVETYSLAGQTERQCKICKADLSRR